MVEMMLHVEDVILDHEFERRRRSAANFAGTGEPLNVWFAHIHARLAWGKLYQSPYSPVSGSARYTSPASSGTARLLTYGTVVVVLSGIPGLRVGVAEFLHLA